MSNVWHLVDYTVTLPLGGNGYDKVVPTCSLGLGEQMQAMWTQLPHLCQRLLAARSFLS